MSNMRVLMVSTDRKVFDPESGVHQRMVEYGSLVDELHIIVFSSRKHEIPTDRMQVAENVWAYPTNSLNRWLYIPDAVKIGRQLTAEWNSFLVTTQDPFETGFAGMNIQSGTNAFLEMQVHTDFLDPSFKRHGFLNRIRILMADFLVPKADCIRVVSKRIKDSLTSQYAVDNSKVSVLPIYVDVQQMQNAVPEFNLRTSYPHISPIILVVSRLEPEKNVGRTIDVFEKVHEIHPSAGLLIVGDGSQRERLEQKVERAGLETHVQFAGWQTDLSAFYKGADVYLHAAADFEGYGRTLVEAAAAGCPIVTPDVGIAGDVLEHEKSARVCESTDIDCFVDEIKWILEDENRAKDMAQKAKKRISEKTIIDKQKHLSRIGELWERCRAV